MQINPMDYNNTKKVEMVRAYTWCVTPHYHTTPAAAAPAARIKNLQ